MFRNMIITQVVILVICCLSISGLASAQEVNANFNDMNLGTMQSVNQPAGTGVGFSSDHWTVNTSVVKVIEGDLTAPAGTNYGLIQSGDAQSVQAQHSSADRRQARDVIDLLGGGWFSFLVKNVESTDISGIDFYNSATEYSVGQTQSVVLHGTNLVIGGTSGGTVDVSSKYSLGETALILGYLETNAFADPETIQVWVNPDVSGGEAGLGVPDFEQLVDLEWEMSRITVLGIQSWDSGSSGTGGIIDMIYLSNDQDAYMDVTGTAEPPYDPWVEQVRDTVNADVDAIFHWKAARDPEGVSEVDPNIIRQDVYMSQNQNVSDDPNLFYIGSDMTITLTDPNSLYPGSGHYDLDYDGLYYWVVVTIMNSGDLKLPTMGDPLSDAIDPNHVVGQVWSFESLATVPVIGEHPQDTAVFQGETADMSVTASSISAITNYEWFKSADNANDTPGDDTSVLSGSTADMLTVTNAQIVDEGYYYCVVSNSAGDTNTQVAALLVKRLVSHWTLDKADTSGGQYLDSAGGNDATIQGTASPAYVQGADGTANGAVVIDANSVANAGTWNPSEISGQMSVAFWANWGGLNGSYQGAVGKANDWSDNMWYIRGWETTSTSLRIFRTGVHGPEAGPMADDGQWQLIVFTFDGTTATAYLDGANDGSSAWSLGSGLDSPIWLGTAENATAGRLFNGAMDDIRIYNYALTSEDVAQLYYDVTGQSTCLNPPDARLDITGPEGIPDCKINLYDFSVIAANWLDCGLYPNSLCP